MHDKPSDVLRKKKDASIQVACRLVKDGLAHGVVSAGNSGATMACGMFVLGRVDGVARPALASVMPSEKRPFVLVDVGANMDAKPHHLFQFGILADVFARTVLGYGNPRVGLLSIGEEAGKGNTLVRETYDLLSESTLHFKGNIEGRDVFGGECDIVVCDGFIGNVVLKLSEGLSMTLSRMLKRELTRDFISTLGTMLAGGALKRFKRTIDYAEYGGAPVLGLKSIVIVCHGASSIKAIRSATIMAHTFVANKAMDLLASELAENIELTSSHPRHKRMAEQ